MRSAIVIASVIVGSVIPSQAFAQTDVFSSLGNLATEGGLGFSSTYKFSGSMILNSIGFLTTGGVTALKYSINGTEYTLGTHFDLAQLSTAENGIQYLTIDRPMVKDDEVKVNTFGGSGSSTAYYKTIVINSSANVSYQGMRTWLPDYGVHFSEYTNSNLRVSPANPSSNVAPEPGSFALALTGGAALIGMCIRRRRNAA